jgi:outer membrane protein OmpA-like peptidoglycan-associated protein
MRINIFKTLLFFTLILVPIRFLKAQENIDADNCKDHLFFNRIEKFYISECKQNYNEYEFTIGEDKTQTFEGTVTEIQYSYSGPDEPNLPSKLQVVKNYESAILKMGGKKIYSSTLENGGFTGATFYFKKDGSEYWLGIYNLKNNPVNEFTFILLKKEVMIQEIKGNEMFDKINGNESLILYITFETGKSTIKIESQSIINELYKMLVENPTLNIVIEGHTDDVGNSTTNKILSKQRAENLKNELNIKGISLERISTVGYGQEKPIADNKLEEGRAKNRRVVIRKV